MWIQSLQAAINQRQSSSGGVSFCLFVSFIRHLTALTPYLSCMALLAADLY